MSLNFPDSPHQGDTYTSAGVTWVWDGVKWVPQSGLAAQGGYLPLTGGTLTGPLVLAADPTLSLGAVTKQYVDARFGAPVIVSDTAPISPKPGALWFDSVGSQLYCWYVDPNTSQWVIVVNQATGPPGLQGTPGATGPMGPTGLLGPVGPAGPKGDIGPQGPIGNTGPQGPIGNTGATGSTGAQGAVGPAGPQGNGGPQGTQGPAGATGAKGDTGPQGPQGIPGPVGPQGAVPEAPTDGYFYGRVSGAWASGGTVSGALTVINNALTVRGSGSIGYVQLNIGDSTHTGYISFWNAAGTRSGYLGYSSGALTLQVSEGSTSSLNINGPTTVQGSLSSTSFSSGAASFSGAVSTGSLTVGGTLDARGQTIFGIYHYFGYPNVADWITGTFSGNYRISQFASGWYWRWDGSTGQIDWIGNNSLFFSIGGSGIVTIQQQLTTNSHIYCQQSGMRVWTYGQGGFYSDANYLMIGDSSDAPAASAWKYYWTRSNGQRNWVANGGGNLLQISPGGACTCPGGFSTASDAAIKRDIEPATDAALGMAALRKITPSYFHRIHNEMPEGMTPIPDRREFGFIAQDVQAALPDAVIMVETSVPYLEEGETDPDKMKTMDSASLAIEIMPMLAALTNAVKELDKRLAAIEAKNGP